MTFPISGKNKIHVPNHQPVDLMGYLMMIPSGNHTLDGKCPRNMEAWIIYPWWIFNCHIWAPSGSESLNKENEEYVFFSICVQVHKPNMYIWICILGFEGEKRTTSPSDWCPSMPQWYPSEFRCEAINWQLCYLCNVATCCKKNWLCVRGYNMLQLSMSLGVPIGVDRNWWAP